MKGDVMKAWSRYRALHRFRAQKVLPPQTLVPAGVVLVLAVLGPWLT